MLQEIIWFLLPAAVANMAAGVSGKLFPKFTAPMDFGLTFRNKRVFGDHKTIRGLIFGVLVGACAYLLQSGQLSALAFTLPLGALMGDAIKSFFKRQCGVASGRSWFPFDQIDWVLGSLLFSYPFVQFSLVFAVYAVCVGLVLHILVKAVGFLLKLQEEPF